MSILPLCPPKSTVCTHIELTPLPPKGGLVGHTSYKKALNGYLFTCSFSTSS
jgi:hypothetical protein